jgi:hypothetical protein
MDALDVGSALPAPVSGSGGTVERVAAGGDVAQPCARYGMSVARGASMMGYVKVGDSSAAIRRESCS